MGHERGIGGDDDDDGTVAGDGYFLAGQFLAHGNAGDEEFGAAPAVGVDKHAHNVSIREDAGGGADAGFEFVGTHARARTYGAFGYGAGCGGFDGLHDVITGDVAPGDVVEATVVTFGHHGQGHAPGMLFEHIGDCAAVAFAHAEGVGEDDGHFEQAAFVDPGHPGNFAVAVEDFGPGKDLAFIDIIRVGQDGGDARAHGAFADDEGTAAFDEGDVAHAHAGHVGDGVVRTRGQAADLDAQGAGAGTLCVGVGKRQADEQDEEIAGQGGVSLKSVVGQGSRVGKAKAVARSDRFFVLTRDT